MCTPETSWGPPQTWSSGPRTTRPSLYRQFQGVFPGRVATRPNFRVTGVHRSRSSFVPKKGIFQGRPDVTASGFLSPRPRAEGPDTHRARRESRETRLRHVVSRSPLFPPRLGSERPRLLHPSSSRPGRTPSRSTRPVCPAGGSGVRRESTFVVPTYDRPGPHSRSQESVGERRCPLVSHGRVLPDGSGKSLSSEDNVLFLRDISRGRGPETVW